MDLSYGPEYEAFRAEVRAFAKEFGGRAPRGTAAAMEGSRDWQKLLIEHGYAARTIPREYGGYGAEPDVLKSRIIAEEFIAAGLPMGMAGQGISMLVPTLLELGTEEQKKKFIASDAARRDHLVPGLFRTRRRIGSCLAHHPRRGRRRRLRHQRPEDLDLDGGAGRHDLLPGAHRSGRAQARRHLLSPLLHEDARHRSATAGDDDGTRRIQRSVLHRRARAQEQISSAQRGQGWFVANATLKHERGMLGDPNQAGTRLKALIDLMQNEEIDGRRLMDNPVFRDRLLKLQARVHAMEFHGLRLLTAGLKGEDPGVARLIVKLMGCELNHQLAAFAIDALGELGILYSGSPHLRRGRHLAVELHVRSRPHHRRRHGADSEEHHFRTRPWHAARTETGKGLGMEFGLTDDQKMMQDSVNRTLERVSPAGTRAQGGGP